MLSFLESLWIPIHEKRRRSKSGSYFAKCLEVILEQVVLIGCLN